MIGLKFEDDKSTSDKFVNDSIYKDIERGKGNAVYRHWN